MLKLIKLKTKYYQITCTYYIKGKPYYIRNKTTKCVKKNEAEIFLSNFLDNIKINNSQRMTVKRAIDIFIENKRIKINDTSWYRGMMFSGIPNLFAHAGYINFSWTARCEIVSQRICKTIRYIKKNKLLSCTPKYMGEKTEPSIQANYILRAMDQFPNRTYKFYQNYIIEYLSFKFTKINDGALDFSK